MITALFIKFSPTNEIFFRSRIMSTQPGSLSPQVLKRLQGGELILQGYENEEIAEIVNVSPSAVKRWRKKLKEHHDDLQALVRKKGSGRIPKLNEDHKQQVKDIVLGGAVQAGYSNERWTSKSVADLIRTTFKIKFSRSSAQRVLHSLGLSPQMPVVQSHKHDDQAAWEWARHTWKRLKKSRENSACH